MSSILAANVTFSSSGRSLAPAIDDDGGRYKKIKCVFGDGILTYPSGGIPLSGLSGAGFPYSVGDVMIMDASNADGYTYKWDSVNNKLRIYNPLATHTHTLFVATGGTDAAGSRANAATNSLAMSNAAASVAGIAAASGAAGGIVNVASAPGAEVATSYAPAASTTLYLWVRGH